MPRSVLPVAAVAGRHAEQPPVKEGLCNMEHATLGTGLLFLAGAISLIAAALPVLVGQPVRPVNVMFLGSGVFWVILWLVMVAKARKRAGRAACHARKV